MNRISISNIEELRPISDIGLHNNILKEIDNVKFSGVITSRSLRETLLDIFCNNGYVKGFKIGDNQNLRITGIKDDIGLSIFLGHYAAVYYEVTKLLYLKNKGIISKAIFVLPSKNLHKNFLKNANMATYERTSNQMSLFNNQFNIDIKFIRIDIKQQ